MYHNNKIATWRGGVHATLLLPSPAKSSLSSYPIEEYSPVYVLHRNRIPANVKTVVLDQLSKSIIGEYGTTEILARLPSSKNPSVSSTSSSTEIKQAFRDVMEIRDLIWAQQLMTEMQLNKRHLAYFETSQRFLADLRMMMRSAEEAALYIKDLAMDLGKKINFEKVDAVRRGSRAPTHPCRLIIPFLESVPSDSGSDGIEDL